MRVSYSGSFLQRQTRTILRLTLARLRERVDNGGDEAVELDRALQLAVPHLFIWLLSFKHAGVAEEREWRLLIHATRQEALGWSALRISEGILVPYVPIMGTATMNPSKWGDRPPLQRITIGPNVKDRRAEEGLRFALEALDCQPVDVYRSSIPIVT